MKVFYRNQPFRLDRLSTAVAAIEAANIAAEFRDSSRSPDPN
jgi:hypothetical protein